MFPNLNAELARQGIKTRDLAEKIKISEKSANNKLTGRTEWTLSEMRAIKNLFPSLSLEYLFAN